MYSVLTIVTITRIIYFFIREFIKLNNDSVRQTICCALLRLLRMCVNCRICIISDSQYGLIFFLSYIVH